METTTARTTSAGLPRVWCHFLIHQAERARRGDHEARGGLHTQYVVSFVPDQVTSGLHTIDIRLAHPSDNRVRARAGYWSKEELR
jgi:hypothetical protein